MRIGKWIVLEPAGLLIDEVAYWRSDHIKHSTTTQTLTLQRDQAQMALDDAIRESENLIVARDAATKQVEILTERLKMRDELIQRQDDKLDALELKLKRLEKAAKPKPAKPRVMKAPKGKKAPVA